MQNFETNPRGQVAIFAVLLLAVLATFVSVLTASLLTNNNLLLRSTRDALALQVAESGIDRAIWCLNHQTICPPPYTGETQTQGAGEFTSLVTGSGNTRVVTSTGTVNGIERTVRITAEISTSTANFFYGLQAGVGGIEMEQNNTITGNVFANGPIDGRMSTITGDVILAAGNPTIDAESIPSPYTTTNFGANAVKYVVQSFVPMLNDKVYQIDLKVARTVSAPSNMDLMLYTDSGNNPGALISGATVTVPAAIFPINASGTWETGWTEIIFTPQTQLAAGTRYWVVLKLSSNDASRYYTVLHANNVETYASGNAKHGDSATTSLSNLNCATCDIGFRVRMGGVNPVLKVEDGVGGKVFAHTIEDTEIGQHACYQNLVSTVTGHTETCNTTTSPGATPCDASNTTPNTPSNGSYCHRNNPNPTPAPFPLTTAQIAQMEAQAADGGTVNCSLGCTVSSGSIGPKLYDGDLTIGGAVTLTGTIWVKGNIYLNNNITLSTGYGPDSGIIIADYTTDPNDSTKGRIDVGGGDLIAYTYMPGMPQEKKTYILAISMSKSLLTTEDEAAFSVKNNLTAAIVYAANGSVYMKNNAALYEITAQKIIMKNGASITYQSGLSDVNFSGGPGASWEIRPQSWEELQ